MVLDRERGRQLIKIRVRIVGVPCDHAMFRPVHNRRFMNAEANSSFGCHQHTAVAKPIIARAERVSMDEVGNAQRGEAGMAAPRSSRSAGTKLLLVVGDMSPDVHRAGHSRSRGQARVGREIQPMLIVQAHAVGALRIGDEQAGGNAAHGNQPLGICELQMERTDPDVFLILRQME